MIYVRIEKLVDFGPSDFLVDVAFPDIKFCVSSKDLLWDILHTTKIPKTLKELWELSGTITERDDVSLVLGYFVLDYKIDWGRSRKRIAKSLVNKVLYQFKYHEFMQSVHFPFYLVKREALFEQKEEKTQFVYSENLPYRFEINLSSLFKNIYENSVVEITDDGYTMDEIINFIQIFQLVQEGEIII